MPRKSRGNWGQSPQKHHEGGEAAANYPRAATGLEAPGPTCGKCPRNSRSKIEWRLKFARKFEEYWPEIARNYRSKSVGDGRRRVSRKCLKLNGLRPNAS